MGNPTTGEKQITEPGLVLGNMSLFLQRATIWFASKIILEKVNNSYSDYNLTETGSVVR